MLKEFLITETMRSEVSNNITVTKHKLLLRWFQCVIFFRCFCMLLSFVMAACFVEWSTTWMLGIKYYRWQGLSIRRQSASVRKSALFWTSFLLLILTAGRAWRVTIKIVFPLGQLISVPLICCPISTMPFTHKIRASQCHVYWRDLFVDAIVFENFKPKASGCH